MAKVIIAGSLKTLAEVGDTGTVTASPTEGFTSSNNQIPDQTLSDTADASGDWQLPLVTGQLYIFEFKSTDKDREAQSLKLRKWVAGVGTVNFEDLTDEAP